LRRRNDGPSVLVDAVGMTTSRAVNGRDTVADLLTRSPHAARLLLDRGMHCVGCAVAPFETLAEVCAIYGVSLDRLLLDLAGSIEAERTAKS
jgi:hybrid cluster-associated redox disulfide protein